MKKKILFASSNEIWGGSEVLWSSAAHNLVGDFSVSFLATSDMKDLEYVKKLAQSDVAVEMYGRYKKKLLLNRLIKPEMEVRRIVANLRPDLVVISLGSHFSIGLLPKICAELNVPYVFVFQLVNDDRWIETESTWRAYCDAVRNAKACYFVSKANQLAIEKMVASPLPNSIRIENPFQVNFDAPFSYPPVNEVYRLANVARYSVGHKGQDVLLEVLSQKKWKDRPIEVHFVGNGPCAALIQGLIEYYGIKNASLKGYTKDVNELWKTYHGLILPSRREGSALALIEAMILGRVPICTEVGSAGEFITDNESGFLARYAHAEFVDEALERAWNKRSEWLEIAKLNYDRSRELFKTDPIDRFCQELRTLL